MVLGHLEALALGWKVLDMPTSSGYDKMKKRHLYVESSPFTSKEHLSVGSALRHIGILG
jgi:hypothetical protein